ncbi:alpha/beta hydrolase [Saccharopolyspora sp. HNM0983]|uniref:Alpha/beta hydrolase n=1 Tax=Saccharopolyspora montiporae TaxID=2781240 RepID=A0A929B9Z0_9PSEU|nr:alpha/beta hydrolase [Saccharopolyspora sp. HNM0983]MBE9373737.1 alpha/beta hydrolase [Saccharopolyspora sp. HNM0983]
MTASTFTDHRTLDLTGGRLRAYEAGPSDALPVLLLHGAMLDTAALLWRHLLPELARDHRVVAIDMPRHGGSRPWSGLLGQARMEGVLDELLDRLGIDRTAIVGLSMGGGVATGYALSRPDRVGALVAINPGGLDRTRPLQLLTWLFLRCDPLLYRATRWVSAPTVLRRFMLRHLAHGTATRDIDAVLALVEQEGRLRWQHRERALDDWQIASYGPLRMAVDHTPRLPRMQVPSLWIHGGRDTAIREHVVRRAAGLAPRGRFAGFRTAGHLAPLDEPDAINAAIRSFLDTSGRD